MLVILNNPVTLPNSYSKFGLAFSRCLDRGFCKYINDTDIDVSFGNQLFLS